MTKLATLVVLAMAAGCKGGSTDGKDKAERSKPTAPGSAGSGSAGSAGSAAPAGWNGTGPLLLSDGFAAPESALYDADADVYLVSNVNGAPNGADDNGYITRISPRGVITDSKWIDGTKDSVKLDAPKGMAIVGGLLYVADISVVRLFDAKTGAAKGEIQIDGATFLNDVAAAPDGGVFVTDSDAIFRIAADRKVTPLLKNKTLGDPHGIVVGIDGLVWVVTFKTGEIFSIDAKGKKQVGKKLPKGQLDGIVALDGGDFLVSSWGGESIYRGRPLEGDWRPIMAAVKSPADIGIDRKHKRLLVPSFEGNAFLIQPFQ